MNDAERHYQLHAEDMHIANMIHMANNLPWAFANHMLGQVMDKKHAWNREHASIFGAEHQRGDSQCPTCNQPFIHPETIDKYL